MESKNHGSPSFVNVAALLLFAIVIAVASVATTYFVLNSRSNEQYSGVQPSVISPPQTYVQPTSPPIGTTQTALDETAGWKVYTNNVFRFSFKYPPSLSVVEDKLQQDKTQASVANQSLSLADSTNNMSLTLYINPLGFGGAIPDMTYKIIYSQGQGFSVRSTEQHYYSTEERRPPPGKTVINADNANSQEEDIQVFMTFSFNEDVSNGEATFKQILSTFKFLE